MKAFHRFVYARDGMRLVFIHGTLVKSFDLIKSYKTFKMSKYYRLRRRHASKLNIYRMIFIRHSLGSKYGSK